MTETEVRAAIARERRELAAVLDALSPERWDHPTLCAGWQVRHVAAHMTMPFRYSPARFVLELIKSRGRFTAMADRCARSDAAAIPDRELAATMRANAEHRWKPPGGGFEGALIHDVIHGLDFCVPLGVDRRVPAATLRLVMPRLTDPRGLKFFGTDLDGVELRADDLDWSFGTGAPITGRAQDLALLICGRRLPAGSLTGCGSERFTD